MVEQEAASEDPLKKLKLLVGAEDCDPALERFGFKDSLFNACRTRKLFPRLDGTFEIPQYVRRPPKEIWYELADPTIFPEMLLFASGEEELIEFLSHLEFPWYEAAELRGLLELLIEEASPAEAGILVGKLLKADQLPSNPVPALLISAEENILPASHTAFLPAERAAVDLPPWVREFGFLHRDFVDALQQASGWSSNRYVQRNLSSKGYQVAEFQVDAIARQLAREARRETEASPSLGAEYCRAVLRCLFDLVQAQTGASAIIDVNLPVITTTGAVKPARQCYLGPAYPRGELLHALYAPLGEDEFVAAPIDLGLSHDLEDVEAFLVRLGVAPLPRPVSVKYVSNVPGLEGFTAHVLRGASYPLHVVDKRKTLSSPQAAENELRDLHFSQMDVPVRLLEVMEHGEAEAIIAYLLDEGLNHLNAPDSCRAVLWALHGQQQNSKPYRDIPVPDPVYYALKTQHWVPCEDGKRRAPSAITLNWASKLVLGDIFHNHALDTNHPLLTRHGGERAAAYTLSRLGAPSRLSDLEPSALYDLLLNLPDLDPAGKHAPSIYRSLLEDQPHAGVTSSEQRKDFLRTGRMWGEQGGRQAYYPVAELRYWGRQTLPAPVRKQVPLVSIDARRGPQTVKQLFGVQPLRQDDFQINVDEMATQEQAWSSTAKQHLTSALPFIYALRLTRKSDEDLRERNALQQANLKVCKRLAVRLSVLDGPEEPSLIDEEMASLIINDNLYLVCHAPAIPTQPTHIIFWSAIGRLLAERIDVGGAAAEFAQLLSCNSLQHMRQLLDFMTAGDADELLAQARQRLDLPKGPIPLPQERPIPVPDAAPSGEPSKKEQSVPVDPGRTGTDPPTGTFTPTPPPPPARPQSRRRRIVRKKPAPGGSNNALQRTDEETTLEIVRLYEENAGRFTLPVNHLQGEETPRCDIISFSSEEIRDSVRTSQMLNPDDVVRFIEVKGRSSRTSLVELDRNQRAGALEYRERYYLYRVYADRNDSSHFELAVLPNPANAPAERTTTLYQYDLREGSGAEWFELISEEEQDK